MLAISFVCKYPHVLIEVYLEILKRYKALIFKMCNMILDNFSPGNANRFEKLWVGQCMINTFMQVIPMYLYFLDF